MGKISPRYFDALDVSRKRTCSILRGRSALGWRPLTFKESFTGTSSRRTSCSMVGAGPSDGLRGGRESEVALLQRRKRSQWVALV